MLVYGPLILNHTLYALSLQVDHYSFFNSGFEAYVIPVCNIATPQVEENRRVIS